VAPPWLFEPAHVQIKRHCGLIWHEKVGLNPLFAVRRSLFAIRGSPVLAKSEQRTTFLYLLYNSTISCSFTGNWMSSRFGSASTRPL
jgi:hypothetical protein